MKRLEPPVTRQAAREDAESWADDAETVVEVSHPAFNADPVSGGVAFRCDRGLAIYAWNSSRLYALDPRSEEDRNAEIEDFWREEQHGNRQVDFEDVSPWHQAAIRAIVAGIRSVGDLSPHLRRGIDDITRADYLLVCLQRACRGDQTESRALRALAAADWLMEVPEPGLLNRAHSCPICAAPAIGHAWQYESVCDTCYDKAVCNEGRRFVSYNTAVSGGFEAKHLDDKTMCAQVTGDNRCWIEGIECYTNEAKFGGTFIGLPFDHNAREQ